MDAQPSAGRVKRLSVQFSAAIGYRKVNRHAAQLSAWRHVGCGKAADVTVGASALGARIRQLSCQRVDRVLRCNTAAGCS